MTYRVEVTDPAEQDADAIFGFIHKRSPQGVSTWWRAFLAAVDNLAAGPATLTRAPESDAFEEPLYQMLFKTRRGNPYRMLFVIRGDMAYVLRIRGFGQRLILPDEVTLPGLIVFALNVSDFQRIHTEYMFQGRRHAGIVLAAQQRYSVGERIRRLQKLIATRSSQ